MFSDDYRREMDQVRLSEEKKRAIAAAMAAAPVRRARHALRWGVAAAAVCALLVATAAVGYGDGYHRACSNRGAMLVRGRRAPIVGRVCMDQTMLDVTDIPGVAVGDEAVLLGRQGQERIDAVELASWAGTISYEVLLAITARVPRIYLNADV